jgi:beta-ureidopropionase / N-carbamoyl-L-amino-acid hydrolase
MLTRRQFASALLAAAPALASPTRARLSGLQQAAAPPRLDGERLNARLAALAKIGATADGGTNRPAYSDEDLQARQFVISLMREAGLDVSVDVAGNIVGRRAGGDARLKPLMIGSHIDSVPSGGRFDGQLGSLAAIEVAQALGEQRVRLRHPLEVAIFQNEEGGTVGSTALGRGLTDAELAAVNSSGKSVRDGIRFLGGDPEKLAAARRRKGDLAGYLELHIEQGGILDAGRIDIGVVEGIVGVYRWDVTIQGAANHAGTTPMNARRDALLAASRYVDAVNQVVTSVPGRQVGTVGRIQAFPGAYNVVPGTVVTSLDLRDLDASKVQALFDGIAARARQIEAATGTTFHFQQVNASLPAPTDARFRRAIDEAAKELGLSTRLMPSGAGHDAQEIAELCPMGMIFIPSRDGISHSPREFSTPESVTNGANVLLRSLLKLDAGESRQ